MGFTKMKRAVLLFFLFSFLSDCLYGSCGSASCPLNNFHAIKAGWFNLGYTYEYINQDQIYVGKSKAFVGAIPEDHNEVQTLNSINNLHFQYGILNDFGLSVDLPFVHREHIHIDHLAAGPTYQGWNFTGLGDMRIDAQYAILSPSEEFQPYFSLSGGVKLATGVTGLMNNEGEAAEVTIQPGTGSTDGIIGLHYEQTLASVRTISGAYSALPLTAGVSYQFNGAGTNGYRFGNTLLVHLGTAYQFSHRASALLQANGRFQGFADVGTTGEPRENTGGTWMYLSPGLSLQLNDALTGSMYVQLPLYQDVHGIQQTAKYHLAFNLSYSFNLDEAE